MAMALRVFPCARRRINGGLIARAQYISNPFNTVQIPPNVNWRSSFEPDFKHGLKAAGRDVLGEVLTE